MKFLNTVLFFVLMTSLLNAADVNEKLSKNIQDALDAKNSLVQKIDKEKESFAKEMQSACEELKKAEENLALAKSEFKKCEFLSENLKELQSFNERITAALGKLDDSYFDLNASKIKKDAIFAVPEKYILISDEDGKIAKFESGLTDLYPVDLSMGKSSGKQKRNLKEHFIAGGVWMWPILIFGACSLIMAVFKIVQFAKIKNVPENSIEKIFSVLSKGDESSAKNLAKKIAYPYTPMLLKLIDDRNLESKLLEEISYEYMLREGERIYRGLSILSITATISPLLGLLGTVTGIIKIFSNLSAFGAGNANLLSGGISEALITTEFGLIVAIPAFVVHALASRKAKRILSDMEKLAAGFLSANSKFNQ